MSTFLFSLEGRITRSQYWTFVLVAFLIFIVGEWFFGTILSVSRKLYELIADLVLLWPAIAVQAKRWHDRDKSAWWILINFIPIIGWLWALIENGFLRGTVGPNRYGDDPLPTQASAG